MEICFVPDRDYGRFLEQSQLVEKHVGDIVDLDGQILGQHHGIEFYTIGQRKGLGLATGQPLYVVSLDPVLNQVVVGQETDLLCSEFFIANCNWIPFDSPPSEIRCLAKIRYNHVGTSATVYPQPDGTARVVLDQPARAVAPGQACVLYQDDLVVGGGWIWKPVSRSHVQSDPSDQRQPFQSAQKVTA